MDKRFHGWNSLRERERETAGFVAAGLRIAEQKALAALFCSR
jgi:hypothetical protein